MKTVTATEQVDRYVTQTIVVESALEKRLRAETYELPNGGMISGSDVGALLNVLALSNGTRNAIEVGTFTGYTALKIASALPAGGRLVCCDISTEWTDMGRRYWKEAGLSEKIDLRIAPATETLAGLLDKQGEGSFDFAFIDADKKGYDAYYEACMKLLRPGGVIVLDNMLWGGDVADESVQDDTTIAIRKMNLKISQDSRVNAVLLTVGDGVMVARKK